MSGKREYGDYQTPIEFAQIVCRYLKEQKQISPSIVIEPTCGVGNFLRSSLVFDAKEYYGIEINPEYCRVCRESINDTRVSIINMDVFSFFSRLPIKNNSQTLLIGNPPWVTNSALSVLESNNLPKKNNFKHLKGIDAITGASNFDICEYIILRLVNEYRNTDTTICMLCKTSVARNVFMELKKQNVFFSSFEMLNFDATKVFGINADACVLVMQLSNAHTPLAFCSIYSINQPGKLTSQLEYKDGQLRNIMCSSNDDFLGKCCFEWRQGVKHDCSKIMELSVHGEALYNGQKEEIKIEEDLIFPLVKSSMFKTPIICNFSKYVIVTQKNVREETEHLQRDAPRTWEYLSKNVDLFKKRKSSIYHNAPQFSMFGIGSYSYAKYKVGISGFYKKPIFSILYSEDKKPVMTDDTSYFICFDTYDMAYVAMLLLNSQRVQKFLTNITFLDAKRPYTKKVLGNISFNKIISKLTIDDLLKTEQLLNLPRYVTASKYKNFKTLVLTGQTSLM